VPVSIDDFESGDLPRGPSVPQQTVSFLYANRDRAFTRSEIARGIDEDPNTVGTALSRLKNRGLVRHKGEYWAITDDLERVADAYDLHTVSERLDGEDGGIDPDEWDSVAPDQPHPSERDANEGNR
jgi:Mn-dependent DtxR family transcriptional regulator